MSRSLLIVALIGLSACTEPQAPPQKMVETASAACQSYGFKPGTPELSQCIATEVRALQDERRRKAQAIAGAFDTMGQAMAAPAQRSVNCRSTRGYGGSVNTTCY